MFKKVLKKEMSEEKKTLLRFCVTVAFVVLFNAFVDVNIKSILVIIPIFVIAMGIAIKIDLKKMRSQHDADGSDPGEWKKAKFKYFRNIVIVLVFFIACMGFVATRPAQLYDEMRSDIRNVDAMDIWSPLEEVKKIEVPDAKTGDFIRLAYNIKMKPVGISKVKPIPDGEEIYHIFLHDFEKSEHEDVAFTTDGYIYIDNIKYELKPEDTEKLIDFIGKAGTLEL